MVDYVGGDEDNDFLVTLADSVSNVDGGGGTDHLTVDWSTAPVILHNSWLSSLDEVTLYAGSKRVNFRNIEHLTVLAGRGNDSFFFYDRTDVRVRYDGGAGTDFFGANFENSVNDIVFTLNATAGAISVFEGQGSAVSNVESVLVKTGAGNDRLTGGVRDDILSGGTGRNVMNGGAGDDSLTSSGIDKVNGGEGSDLWLADYRTAVDALSFTQETAVRYSVSNGTVAASIEKVKLFGGSANDVFSLITTGDIEIRGGEGQDSLFIDWSNSNFGRYLGFQGHAIGASVNGQSLLSSIEMESLTAKLGGGNDQFNINTDGIAVVDGGAGVDRLSGWFATATKQMSLILDETPGAITTLVGQGSTFVNFEKLYFSTGYGNDTLIGGSNDDGLFGSGGDDWIDGAGGSDVMDGGEGVDTVSYGRATAGVVVSLLKQGTGYVDTVGGGVDDLKGFENIVGSGFADTLTGDYYANIINGGAGADQMSGMAGDDVYRVDDAGDVTIEVKEEFIDGGYDRVDTSVSFTLADRIEAMTLLGTADIDATGNEQANLLTGNSGGNRINGKQGADEMRGMGGDDIYYVDNAGDKVFESKDGGIDLIYSSVSYNLGGQYAENLQLLGSANIRGTGNSQANEIIGNSGNNLLRGLGGNDVLTGGAGLDNFQFETKLGARNVDIITDFSVRDDTIRLDRSVFTELGATGWLNADAFVVGTQAVDDGDRILYDNASGRLHYDADGTGSIAPVLFANLTTGLSLTNLDILVIA